jgi:HAD superfamily hydrolase (TIGR01509 family)
MKKKYRGIIFDVDGTLTSTNQLIYEAFNHITKKFLNKEITPQEVIDLFGPTEDEIIDRMFPETSYEVKKDYYKFYEDNHHLADVYPGMHKILEKLKLKGLLLSIFTGKGRKAAEITLKKLELYDFFDLIISGDEVENHKPSAEGIIKFLDEFHLERKDVLMVGDSPADIKAARAAGVEVASVLWDSYAKDEVLKMKSNYIFHTVEELNNFFE